MVRLQREPLDLAALQAVSPKDGALCLFVGVVRNENGGRPVLRLEYEAYEEMALPLMAEIEAEVEGALARDRGADGPPPRPPGHRRGERGGGGGLAPSRRGLRRRAGTPSTP